MEIAALKGKLVSIAQKYKYAIVIVLIGLALIMLPLKDTSSDVVKSEIVKEEKVISTAEELEEILSKVHNAGEVKVLLSIESGEMTVYQTDDDISNSEDNSTTQINTVLITGVDRDEHGLVRQVIPPVYKGAIVVCQGADDPKVRLAIVDAVATVTGLGADRISVLKMK